MKKKHNPQEDHYGRLYHRGLCIVIDFYYFLSLTFFPYFVFLLHTWFLGTQMSPTARCKKIMLHFFIEVSPRDFLSTSYSIHIVRATVKVTKATWSLQHSWWDGRNTSAICAAIIIAYSNYMETVLYMKKPAIRYWKNYNKMNTVFAVPHIHTK